MKRKISILCSSYPPERGAAPNRMYHLAMMLQAHGFEVNVISAMPNYPTGKVFAAYKRKLVCRETYEGIALTRIWLWPTNAAHKWKRALSLLSYSASLLVLGTRLLRQQKPDLLIVSSPPFVTGYIGMKLSKRLGIRSILNISDIWPQSAYDLGYLHKGLLLQRLQKMEQKMYARATAFSVQSAEIEAHIRQYEKEQNLFLYRNLSPSVAQAALERPAGKRKIVYAGLLGIAQGVLGIIQSIDFAVLGTELHLYGQGTELEEIQKWLGQYPERGVYYQGSVAPHLLPDILSTYHAMLVPLTKHIYGAVPSKIFNAMANGLPILFSGDGEAAELVAASGTGFSSGASDMLGLQASIVQLVGMDEQSYGQMRQCCSEAIAHHFNKAVQDDAFVALIQSLIRA